MLSNTTKFAELPIKTKYYHNKNFRRKFFKKIPYIKLSLPSLRAALQIGT